MHERLSKSMRATGKQIESINIVIIVVYIILRLMCIYICMYIYIYTYIYIYMLMYGERCVAPLQEPYETDRPPIVARSYVLRLGI